MASSSSTAPPPAPNAGKIPVTVLTGFLGAGKTTLLKYILTQNHGKKIAVIQNEYAEEMGIEAPTLIDAQTDKPFADLWELPNGCICCSAKDDFVAAIDALLKFQKENSSDGKQTKFDYIVVESTGLADPEAVIQTFWVDEGLDSSIFLDGVVCVVDASRVLKIFDKDCKDESSGSANTNNNQSDNDIVPNNPGSQKRGSESMDDVHGSPSKKKKIVANTENSGTNKTIDNDANIIHSNNDSDKMDTDSGSDSDSDNEAPPLFDLEKDKMLKNSETVGARAKKRYQMKLKETQADEKKILDSEPTSLFSEYQKQIYCADVILCNKLDLLKNHLNSAGENAENFNSQQHLILQTLQSANRDCTVFETEYSIIELEKILDLRAFDANKIKDRLTNFALEDAMCMEVDSVPILGNGTNGKNSISPFSSKNSSPFSINSFKKPENHGIQSVLVKFEPGQKLSAENVERFVAEMLWDRDESDKSSEKILRAKGIFEDSEENELHALQSVGETFEVAPLGRFLTDSKEEGSVDKLQAKFLFLGTGLDKSKLEKGLLGAE